MIKLQDDMNKLKSLYEQERFINDQLSLQLQDYQNIAERHKIQVFQCLFYFIWLTEIINKQEELLKKQINDLINKLKAATTNVFEREQFKQMFSKLLSGMFEK